MKLIYYPRKELGQNFIFNDNYLNELIDSFDIKRESVIIEIGSGYGNMTNLIAKKKWCKKIISIEKEEKLFNLNLKNNDNKKILYILSDALKIDWKDLIKKNFLEEEKIIILGNLPFNISNTLILNLIISKIKFKKMFFMIQKEVGEVWCSYNEKNHKKKRTALSALISFFYNTKIIIKKVDKNIFFPVPKVDGIVISLENLEKNKKYLDDHKNIMIFFIFLKEIFKQKRKKLINNILKKYRIKKNDLNDFFCNLKIKENERIQDLDLDKLFDLFIFLDFYKKI